MVETIGSYTRNLTMRLFVKDSLIDLHGAQTTVPEKITFHQLKSLLSTDAVQASFHLLVLDQSHKQILLYLNQYNQSHLAPFFISKQTN